MFYAVILTRLDGLRLGRADWPAPLVGTMRVMQWPGDPALNRRARVRIELTAQHGTPRARSLAVLFDPELLPFGGDALAIAGHELHSEDGGHKVWEHRQVWICRPVSSEA